MKRGFVLLLCFIMCVFCAQGETDAAYYENAYILASCPSLCTFKDVPSPLLAGEAIAVYRQLYPDAELDDGSIYALIFANGEYIPADDTIFPDGSSAMQVFTDGITEQPDGSLTVSMRTEIDYGFGFEFGLLADVKLDGITLRVLSVFIPE